ncbi:ABC transporter permease [Nitrincola alkalilacustris]|uniref:ABC transporter permease n=1 Tax=Nitrincola alkalilacustris TaxID=1571224 RepID=UPI00124DCB48|nr:ABC transporter permease [Nitrincola alkalilacustris]
MIRLEKRKEPSKFWRIANPFLAVALTMLAGAVMFAILGKDPIVAIRLIFFDPIFSETFGSYSRPQLLIKSAPLILIAVGLAIGFKANIWNIGAEGQYIIGALFGAGVALAFFPAPGWYIFPLMVVAGAFGGFLWAMIPAILKTRFNTNEILVSLLLVYVAEKILAAMALGLMRNPDIPGFPGSRDLRRYEAAHNAEIFANTGIHWGVVAALIAVIFAYAMMTRHMLGYHVRLAGQAPRAARFGGVSPARLVVICLGISGALAGLAGMFEVSGPGGQVRIEFASGYGFTAIIVAFLGRLNPIGIVLAGLLLGLTYIGGELSQMMLQLPSASIQVFQGMLLFFLLALDFQTNYRLRLTRGARA